MTTSTTAGPASCAATAAASGPAGANSSPVNTAVPSSQAVVALRCRPSATSAGCSTWGSIINAVLTPSRPATSADSSTGPSHKTRAA
ncbi:MAG TPA: hypothetical protein VHH34_24810, partial [Pseudonocardiaceae bacterium]|nr:hypothetical protein [Pseudonocardiaceae bacterium]